MNVLNKLSITVLACILMASCSTVNEDTNEKENKKYSSYNECMKDEIRLNDGKENNYIDKYCTELYKTKIRHVVRKYYVFKSGTVWKLENRGINPINSLRVEIGTSERKYGCKSRTSALNRSINLLSGNSTLQPGDTIIIAKVSSYFPKTDCLYVDAKYIYYE